MSLTAISTNCFFDASADVSAENNQRLANAISTARASHTFANDGLTRIEGTRFNDDAMCSELVINRLGGGFIHATNGDVAVSCADEAALIEKAHEVLDYLGRKDSVAVPMAALRAEADARWAAKLGA